MFYQHLLYLKMHIAINPLPHQLVNGLYACENVDP